jgi:hypothetical protein
MVLPHRQQMLGAPFKPSFGLSGIMALDVPLLQFSHRVQSPSNSQSFTARLKPYPSFSGAMQTLGNSGSTEAVRIFALLHEIILHSQEGRLIR